MIPPKRLVNEHADDVQQARNTSEFKHHNAPLRSAHHSTVFRQPQTWNLHVFSCSPRDHIDFLSFQEAKVRITRSSGLKKKKRRGWTCPCSALRRHVYFCSSFLWLFLTLSDLSEWTIKPCSTRCQSATTDRTTEMTDRLSSILHNSLPVHWNILCVCIVQCLYGGDRSGKKPKKCIVSRAQGFDGKNIYIKRTTK